MLLPVACPHTGIAGPMLALPLDPSANGCQGYVAAAPAPGHQGSGQVASGHLGFRQAAYPQQQQQQQQQQQLFGSHSTGPSPMLWQQQQQQQQQQQHVVHHQACMQPSFSAPALQAQHGPAPQPPMPCNTYPTVPTIAGQPPIPCATNYALLQTSWQGAAPGRSAVPSVAAAAPGGGGGGGAAAAAGAQYQPATWTGFSSYAPLSSTSALQQQPSRPGHTPHAPDPPSANLQPPAATAAAGEGTSTGNHPQDPTVEGGFKKANNSAIHISAAAAA
eukprot:881861-Pelagomonas_calceolata.AAC.1